MSEPNEILAEKSAAEEASSVERCLTFESGGLTLFLSTNYVTEIINDCSITHLPLVPGHVKGILNLRGQILPVVDIRECMGKPSLEYTSKTCIIVLNVDEIPIGIVVDSVDIDLSHVRPIPVKRQQKLLDGMVTMEDGSVLMSFDCNSLAGKSSLQSDL